PACAGCASAPTSSATVAHVRFLRIILPPREGKLSGWKSFPCRNRYFRWASDSQACAVHWNVRVRERAEELTGGHAHLVPAGALLAVGALGNSVRRDQERSPRSAACSGARLRS